jgi:hypothetical protein
MICEKCAGEIGTVICKNCNQEILKLGAYCYQCGNRFEIDMREKEESDFDLESRILCSDGTCIGVVENGFCKLCGKPYEPEA